MAASPAQPAHELDSKFAKRVSLSLSRSGSIVNEALNPFTYTWPNKTWPRRLYTGFKYTCALFMAPIKAATMAGLFGVCLSTAMLANALGPNIDQPPSRLQKLLMLPVRASARLMMFCLGFYWIKVKGKPASGKEAPIIVSNHVHLWEVLYHFYIFGPSAVSRKENAAIPGVGALLRVTRGLFVDRLSPTSRADTLEAIRQRGHLAAKDDRWPQVLIFPEGTTSNGRAVCSFKQGAFTPGLPVQPIAVKYPYRFFDPCWSVDGPGMLSSILHMFCQFVNHMEVTYLPVYYPSEEEKKDPKLYAQNVRDLIANELGLPTLQHSSEDALFQVQVLKHRIPLEHFKTDIHTMHELLHVDFDGAKELLIRFASAHSRGGRIDFEQFCKFLKLPASEDAKDLFEAFDLDQTGTIDFRNLVLGLSSLNAQGDPIQVIEAAWKACDSKGVGHLTQDDLSAILLSLYPSISDSDVVELFLQANTSHDGKLTWEQWLVYWRKHPEYVALAQATLAKRSAAATPSAL